MARARGERKERAWPRAGRREEVVSPVGSLPETASAGGGNRREVERGGAGFGRTGWAEIGRASCRERVSR